MDDDLLRPLYHAPYGELVAARAALAKRLRAAGDPRAAEVRSLPKPPLSAWAVGQLFAREADAMAAFVATGERVRAAQKVASGGGDAQPLRDLLQAVREQAGRLTRRAAEVLAATQGRAPGEAIVERVRGSLDALALDPATAPVAARGWLDADLEPPGFEILAALQVAAAGGRAAGAKERPAPRRPAAPVERLDDRRQAIAERKERERRERVDRLRADLARTEAEAAERQAEADRAALAAENAAIELAAARQRAADATSQAEKARRRAEDAQATADRAREALAQAEGEGSS